MEHDPYYVQYLSQVGFGEAGRLFSRHFFGGPALLPRLSERAVSTPLFIQRIPEELSSTVSAHVERIRPQNLDWDIVEARQNSYHQPSHDLCHAYPIVHSVFFNTFSVTHPPPSRRSEVVRQKYPKYGTIWMPFWRAGD